MSEVRSDSPPSLQAGMPVDSLTFWHEIGRLDGRLNENSRHIERLDENGPRGMEALRLELRQLRGDLQEHEQAHQREVDDRKAARRWAIGLGVLAAVALVAPLYPLILFGHHGP